MSDTGIFATTAEVQYKVGANASSTANVETYINSFMTQAESIINAITNYNWSDKYSTLNIDVKSLLKEAASSWAAMAVISYDMRGIGPAEAQTRLDLLKYKFEFCINELKKSAVREFMLGA